VVPFAQAENRPLKAHRTREKGRAAKSGYTTARSKYRESASSLVSNRDEVPSRPAGPPVNPARARCLSSLLPDVMKQQSTMSNWHCSRVCSALLQASPRRLALALH
jgi:hypothetical protein